MRFSLICDWLSWSEAILKILLIYSLLSHTWLRTSKITLYFVGCKMCCFKNLLSPPMTVRLFWSIILWDYFWAIMSYEAATVYYYITLSDHRTRSNLLNICKTKIYFFLCRRYLNIRRNLEFYLWWRHIFRRSFMENEIRTIVNFDSL